MQLLNTIKPKIKKNTLFFIAFLLTSMIAGVSFGQLYIHFQNTDYVFPFFSMLFSVLGSHYLFLLYVPVIHQIRLRFDLIGRTRNVLIHMPIAIAIATLHIFLSAILNRLIINYKPEEFIQFFYITFGQDLVLVLIGYFAIIAIDYSIEYYEKSRKKSDEEAKAVNPHLVVKTNGSTAQLAKEDIIFCESLDNYVKIHTENQVHVVRTTLKKLAEKLEQDNFHRVHRSYIVNTNAVRKITPLKSGDAELLLSHGASIRMSRTFRKNLPLLL